MADSDDLERERELEPEHSTVTSNTQFELLVPVRVIKNGQTVCKANGSNEYTVRRMLRVHGESPRRMFAAEGTVFLIDPRTGDATCVLDDTKVIVTGSAVTLENFLYDITQDYK